MSESANQSKVVVKIENLFKRFSDTPVLKNINLNIYEGEVLSIIGRSGCGKTTLLRCINCLEILNHGTLTVGETELKSTDFSGNNRIDRKFDKTKMIDFASALKDSELKRKIYTIRKKVGFLFQNYNLFPHLNVLSNVTLSLTKSSHLSKSEADEKALNILYMLGLKEYSNRYPHQLSGGQQQRVAIARALALSPQVMLYDEPTSALDPELVSDVVQIMKSLQFEGISQVIVTHSISLAKILSDRVVYMDDGEIAEIDSPSVLFSNPTEQRTRNYISKMVCS